MKDIAYKKGIQIKKEIRRKWGGGEGGYTMIIKNLKLGMNVCSS